MRVRAHVGKRHVATVNERPKRRRLAERGVRDDSAAQSIRLRRVVTFRPCFLTRTERVHLPPRSAFPMRVPTAPDPTAMGRSQSAAGKMIYCARGDHVNADLAVKRSPQIVVPDDASGSRSPMSQRTARAILTGSRRFRRSPSASEENPSGNRAPEKDQRGDREARHVAARSRIRVAALLEVRRRGRATSSCSPDVASLGPSS